jgi:hypothetical protein
MTKVRARRQRFDFSLGQKYFTLHWVQKPNEDDPSYCLMDARGSSSGLSDRVRMKRASPHGAEVKECVELYLRPYTFKALGLIRLT